MTASSRSAYWHPRYWTYGPITDVRWSDKEKIARLLQRGQPVTDERLVAQALAYARFRARLCAVLGLIFLVLGASEAVALTLGPQRPQVLYVVLGVGFLLLGIGWLWLADRCRRGARATTDARAGLR